MKKTLNRIEKFRVRSGPMASSKSYGRNGAFLLPPKIFGYPKDLYPTATNAVLIISDGSDWTDELGPVVWEHASLSWKHRTPNWTEMCVVKDLLWNEHECVMQFHPPKSSYVNFHKHCLHLWKPLCEFPVPTSLCVGPITI